MRWIGRTGGWLLWGVSLPFLVLGVRDVIRWCRAGQPSTAPVVSTPLPPSVPTTPLAFQLDDSNSRRMTGRNEPTLERWADIAGNFYAPELARRFSYEDTGEQGPCVRVQIQPAGRVLRGRLEAHRLKPNFAYQIKLLGDFADRTAFERIGYRGRWRLPGRGTNYGDWEYENYPDKASVEAYILFDYFVTDRRGDAVHDFELTQSLHVLWNLSRQNPLVRAPNIRRFEVRADDPAVYMRPKQGVTTEFLYAEPEFLRQTTDEIVRLPPGPYRAFLVLTEESFHELGRDNGYWASPLKLPIEFFIRADDDRALTTPGPVPGEPVGGRGMSDDT